MSRREKIEKMLADSPNDVFLNFALGVELAKEGKIDEALVRFDRTAQIDPKYTTAYFQKASTLASAGRLDDSRNAFRVGIEAAKRHGDLHAAEEMQAALDALPS
ncbi:MAG: tetratricopeptide repeat protein [Planctomycetes bacterium]|nr:tetratricopeptide repeat protein [Planctomycetota bacterium]MBI3833330.1 tetratricopeptide repeat protein [Planctomycetota bacterium]